MLGSTPPPTLSPPPPQKIFLGDPTPHWKIQNGRPPTLKGVKLWLATASAVGTISSPLGYLAHLYHKFENDLECNNMQIMHRPVPTPSAIINQRGFPSIDVFSGADIGVADDRSIIQKRQASELTETFVSHSVLIFCDGSAMRDKVWRS